MKRTESAHFFADYDRTRDLDETMELITDGSDEDHEYGHGLTSSAQTSFGAMRRIPLTVPW